MKNQSENSRPSLFAIFIGMVSISSCTFGGGFVITSLMKKKFVDQRHWLGEDEMLDYIAIAQSCPGAIAVNGAILLGLRVRGIPGMIAAVLGTILPPMLILALISVIYATFASSRVVSLLLRGMQAGVAAVLMDVVLSLGAKVIRGKAVIEIAVMVLSFAAVRFLHADVMLVIGAVLLIGILRAFIVMLRERKVK